MPGSRMFRRTLPDQPCAGAGFAAGGRLLVRAGPAGIAVEDAVTLTPVVAITPPSPVTTVAVSSRGNRVAGVSGGGVLVWDVTAGRLERAVPAPDGPVVALSPDGDLLAVGGRADGVTVWRAADGTPVWSRAGTGPTAAPAFSPDGSRLAGGGEAGDVLVWDGRTGGELTRFGQKFPVTAVAFSPDALWLAIGGATGGVHLRSLAGPRSWSVPPPSGGQPVTGIAFSPDGRTVATAGADGAVRVRDTGLELDLITFCRHTGALNGVAFSPDGTQFVTAGQDGRSWVCRAFADREEHARLAARP